MAEKNFRTILVEFADIDLKPLNAYLYLESLVGLPASLSNPYTSACELPNLHCFRKCLKVCKVHTSSTYAAIHTNKTSKPLSALGPSETFKKMYLIRNSPHSSTFFRH
jgi:hypothetical protein